MKIAFEGDGVEVECSAGVSVLDHSKDAGIGHTSLCGGAGRCSTCRILVLDGEVSARSELEEQMVGTRGFAPEVRLACQTFPRSDVRVRRLIRDDMDLELYDQADDAKERDLVILFSDVRSFTPFSERHLPYDVVHILNRYFLAMGEAILGNDGTIDKYMGDGIMALFGVDDDSVEVAAHKALKAAREMVCRLEIFNEYLESQFEERFQMGVGLHVGTVVLGQLGHPKEKQRTVIGDTVNVAARIESATKSAGVPILISEQVAALVDGKQWPQHALSLKGKSGAFDLYAPPVEAP